ncbi:MAG: EAL domain-containing protein [Lachnospiraceae bacterium]|nr:EAL domain-containing protein [Lachnospiraceae bacterium]
MVLTDFLLDSLTVMSLLFFLASWIYISFGKRKTLELLETDIDRVTGLPAKQLHKYQVSEALKNQEGNYAYVSCDIVDFKCYNEAYGYECGTETLKKIASIWKNELNPNEFLTRISEDQFCMLLEYTSTQALEVRLRKMFMTTSDEIQKDRGSKHILAFRCGVYLLEGNQSVTVIRTRAEMARMQAEQCHCTTIAFYDRENVRKRLREKELENDIRNAVEQRELLVYFQPKFDVITEKVSGAEALVRWNHPEKGMLYPESFIPLCEANGYVCNIDFYVLEEVCRRLKMWKESGFKMLKVSVNFSRMHLKQPDFVEQLKNVLAKYDVDPAYVEIELTESIAYGEVQNLVNVMKQVKAAGFGLSMDDFGSGYSSLNLLREMPLDVLKLDKEFFGAYGDSTGREQTIIHHIISMAKDLDITVLAEGVETEKQKEFLKESHCDMIQGFYYAKPMPVDKFTTYINQLSA